MHNKLFSSWRGELAVIDHLSYSGTPMHLPGSQLQIASNEQDYYFLFQEFSAHPFTLRFYQFNSKVKDTYTWISDPMVTLRMGNTYSHIFQLPHLGKQVFHQRDFNLFHIPHFSVEFTLGPDDAVSFMDIIITEEHLQTLKTAYPELLQEFLYKTERRLPARLKAQNAIAGVEVLRWTDKLLDFYSGNNNIQPAQVAEQIFRTCLTVMNTATRRKIPKLNVQEVAKLYRVARFMEETPQKKSIRELSANFKLSAYKLEKGFKEIFGHSVLHHPFEEKMRLACRLIEDKRYNGKQVAEILGYSDPQSFSRAFKKRFGYAPYRNAPKS